MNCWNRRGWRGLFALLGLLVGLTLQTGGAGIRTTAARYHDVSSSSGRFSGEFSFETITARLDTPWDLAWGPDGYIWFTERNGAVSRLHPATGQVSRIAQMDVVEVGESGLMGMAFHPDFSTHPNVYLAYSYEAEEAILNRLVRMRYNGSELVNEQILLNQIPGAGYHDGSRLAVGPDRMLYMTTGDAGDALSAQDKKSLAGKVLRITLGGEVPAENPFGTAVYSYGHRNPQGIVFHPATGALYITEHGPADNDEVNKVVKGGNYGWPRVRGFCDGDARGEQQFCSEHKVVEPMVVWTPTIAPSGADFYYSDLIPGWKGNLLFTTLRGEAVYRLQLSADGNRVVGQDVHFEGQFGRLRDVLVGPQGEIYLATSNRDGRASPASQDDRILRLRPRFIL